jgi:hypothetical protein
MGFGSFLKKATMAPLKLGAKAAKVSHNATMGAAKLGHKAAVAPMKIAAKTTPGSVGKAMGKVASAAGAMMGQKKKKSPGIGPSMM